MKFLKLSTLALAVSLSFGAAMPAEANIFGLLLQKRQHHGRHQHHQPHNRHNEHNEFHSNRRVRYSGDRNHHRSNHHTRHSFPRRRRGRVFNNRRSYGNWRVRH